MASFHLLWLPSPSCRDSQPMLLSPCNVVTITRLCLLAFVCGTLPVEKWPHSLNDVPEFYLSAFIECPYNMATWFYPQFSDNTTSHVYSKSAALPSKPYVISMLITSYSAECKFTSHIGCCCCCCQCHQHYGNGIIKPDCITSAFATRTERLCEKNQILRAMGAFELSCYHT